MTAWLLPQIVAAAKQLSRIPVYVVTPDYNVADVEAYAIGNAGIFVDTHHISVRPHSSLGYRPPIPVRMLLHEPDPVYA